VNRSRHGFQRAGFDVRIEVPSLRRQTDLLGSEEDAVRRLELKMCDWTQLRDRQSRTSSQE